MELLTKDLLAKFQEIGARDGVKDPIVVAKYFNTLDPGTWYATNYDPETKLFFGYVSIFNDSRDEWDYFALEELEALNNPLAFVKLERDILFRPRKLSKELKADGVQIKIAR